MSARRLIRQTMTIARRDFIATVFTPIFLLFLFAPLIMATTMRHAFPARSSFSPAAIASMHRRYKRS